MKRLALLLGLPLLTTGSFGGCSWIFVQPRPDRYEPGDVVDCTTNAVAPVIDTLLTLTNVGAAIYVAGEDNVTNKGTAVTAGLLVGALWFSSAVYGYSKTSDCRDAKDEAADRPTRRLFQPRVPAVGYPEPSSPKPSPATPPPASPAIPDHKIDAPRFGG
jgi:hypothetical protein